MGVNYFYLNDHMRFKSYSASVKGSKSLVRIDIEVDEPGVLGFLLEDLGKIEKRQKADKKGGEA